MRTVILSTVIFLCFYLYACVSKHNTEPHKQDELTEVEQLQLELAAMHFDNGDYALARKEYIRLILNDDSVQLGELAQYMIGESYYREQDCPLAERYFLQYIVRYPTGYKRAESEVRLQQCQEQRAEAERVWTTAKLRRLPQKRVKRRQPRQHMWGKPFRTTWYWVVDEADYARKHLVPLLTPTGRVIKRVPRRFLRRLHVEGTGRLRDGRVVNWAAPKRYVVVDRSAPFGLGAQGRALIPFRSVAVDRNLIPLGTVFYIKEFDGVALPTGRQHDGCFVAADVGSAVRDRHVDLFAPAYEQALAVMQQVPEWVTLRSPAAHCRRSYSIH